MKGKSRQANVTEWLAKAAGTFFLYLILIMVLTFLLERQPSSFIYVSF